MPAARPDLSLDADDLLRRRWLLVFGLGLFVASTIRPSTVLAIVALAPAALVGYAAQRWRGWPRPPATQVVARALAVVVISLAVYGLADRLFDTGARRFNASAFAFRVALYLPPAADTRADRRVEAAKARYQRTAGEPIERARLGNYRGFPLLDYVSFDDAEAVWPGRLQAYPLLYLRSIWDDLFLNHYVIARKYTPFGFDLLRMPLYAQPWPKDDGSPASQIFRATGFVVLDHPYLPEHLPLEVELAQAIGRFLITWTLFGVGVWQCWRRQPGLTAATATTLAVFVVAVSATNTMDARYVLPFAPAIYGAQALGLAWGVRAIGGRC